jgi:hypothetical protein
MKEEQFDVIELLAIHERKVSQLYKAYAKEFPDYQDFWSTLAAEEIEHAKLVCKLKELSVVYDRDRLKIAAIQKSIDHLKYQIAKIQEGGVTLINALSVALDLEKSIMDGKIFEMLKGYSTEAKHVLRELTDAVIKHVEKIEKVWSEHRRYS